jgi:hypothetical protein
MSRSVNPSNISQVYSIFLDLTRQIEPFIKTEDLRIVFDRSGNVFLQGASFSEPIQTDFSLWRKAQKTMFDAIAKHRSLLNASVNTPLSSTSTDR